MRFLLLYRVGVPIGLGNCFSRAGTAFLLHRQLSVVSSRHRRAQNESLAVEDTKDNTVPRWYHKPPVKINSNQHQISKSHELYPANDDPELLDNFFVNLLGQDGDKILPESLKWLTVTHKSFDHGRKGFNERLAFLGRRIVELQTSLALLDAPNPKYHDSPEKNIFDHFGRSQFVHRSLENVESVTVSAKVHILDQPRLARLAERYGLADVIRWRPREIHDLRSSGLDSVLTDAFHAVIGAIALHKGGELANQTVRIRILNPLGIR